mmetsp:Transcript_4502/g.9683  ORF Transcript_4502/g.9683 Transcript_4502/m.9683 type:complete len:235 (+) Transcript_4502:217-921(+)
MVLYGLSLVPLAETLRRSHPDVIQPWYADDAAMHGTVSQIASTMRQLHALGPACGYFPEPAKSIFLGCPKTSARAWEVLEEFNFKFLDGYCYIGGFIGTDEARDAWLEPQIQQWVEGIKLLFGAAKKYPQASFAALTKSLQIKWTYLQRAVPDVADTSLHLWKRPSKSTSSRHSGMLPRIRLPLFGTLPPFLSDWRGKASLTFVQKRTGIMRPLSKPPDRSVTLQRMPSPHPHP